MWLPLMSENLLTDRLPVKYIRSWGISSPKFHRKCYIGRIPVIQLCQNANIPITSPASLRFSQVSGQDMPLPDRLYYFRTISASI